MGKRSATEDVRLTLGVLTAAEAQDGVSQRTLAADLDVAVGLVNAYVKRCVRNGLMKVSQVPARRYRYYLTPAGFAEKAKLTGEYLAFSLSFFRRAKTAYSDVFETAEALRWQSVVLLGAGDLADIATICALSRGIKVVSVIDPRLMPSAGTPSVVRAPRSVTGTFDGYIWTGLPDADMDLVLKRRVGIRVLTPSAERLGLPCAASVALSA